MSSRLEEVQSRIRRLSDRVTLVAVSKFQPVDAIRRLYDEGQRHFGESRLQEALPKIEALPDDIVWHFIGNLQSNKARKIADRFSVIHTLSSYAQLREIAKSKARPNVLIEVNIANEPQKGGIDLESLDVLTRDVIQCEAVQFRGLMTIGPAVDPDAMRPIFRKLHAENERLGGTWLSMGMSNDFEVAIQEGATHVRVGTALFGAR